MGDLQLAPPTADDGPVLVLVELEGLSGLKAQGNECPASCRLQHSLLLGLPLPDKGRNPSIRAVIAQGHEIRVQPPSRKPLLARSPRLLGKPAP